MPKSLRDEWKVAKAKYSKDLDMTKVVDKLNYGGLLDVYEAKVKAYEKLMDTLAKKPDAKKAKAAMDAVKLAATSAIKAGAAYAVSLHVIEKGTPEGPTKVAAQKLANVIMFDIGRELEAGAKGNI